MLDALDLELATHFARDATAEDEHNTATGLAGGAYVIGAAFAPHLDQVMTLAMFTAHGMNWGRVEIDLLANPNGIGNVGSSEQFPEVNTALAWFEALPTPR